MAIISSLAVSLTANTLGFERGIGRAAKRVNILATSVQTARLALGRLAGVLGIFGAGMIARLGFKLASEFEQAGVAMTTMLGDAQKAKTVLDDLTRFAAATPFEFPALIEATRTLAAFGVAADQIIPSLRMLGDIASGTAQPINELAWLYGKVRLQNRLFARELRQFAVRGIPVMKQLAQNLGVTDEEVRKLVEHGKIGFRDVQQVLIQLADEGGRFHNLMYKQVKTLGGAWSNLKDVLGITLRKIFLSISDTFNIRGKLIKMQEWLWENVGNITTWATRVINAFTYAWSVVSPILAKLYAKLDFRMIAKIAVQGFLLVRQAAQIMATGLKMILEGLSMAFSDLKSVLNMQSLSETLLRGLILMEWGLRNHVKVYKWFALEVALALVTIAFDVKSRLEYLASVIAWGFQRIKATIINALGSIVQTTIGIITNLTAGMENLPKSLRVILAPVVATFEALNRLRDKALIPLARNLTAPITGVPQSVQRTITETEQAMEALIKTLRLELAGDAVDFVEKRMLQLKEIISSAFKSIKGDFTSFSPKLPALEGEGAETIGGGRIQFAGAHTRGSVEAYSAALQSRRDPTVRLLERIVRQGDVANRQRERIADEVEDLEMPDAMGMD